jgi:uncharacterized membrane protein
VNFFNLTAQIPKSKKVRDTSTIIERSIDTVGELPHSQMIEERQFCSNASSKLTIEQFISSLLKYGVLLASVVVLLGGILYLVFCGNEPANYQLFRGEPSQLSSPVPIVKEALSGNPLSIIQLGLLILIATPITRVALSVLIFLWQRDWLYAIITLFVLSELLYSFIGAYF